jgi:hypothetical protein
MGCGSPSAQRPQALQSGPQVSPARGQLSIRNPASPLTAGAERGAAGALNLLPMPPAVAAHVRAPERRPGHPRIPQPRDSLPAEFPVIKGVAPLRAPATKVRQPPSI